MNPNHVIIAGAQKCGTTTLFRWLRSHPSLCTAVKREDQGSEKELHYFAGKNWRHGFDWYVAQYSKSGRRCIDATPLYLSHPEAAPRIARVFPEARIIVTLRDPVARALSQYNHYRQDLPASENWDWKRPGASFSENVHEELRNPFPNWKGLLGRGRYAEQLRYWHKFVAPHRMLVLVMEEWSAKCIPTYEEILHFLQLEYVPPRSLDPVHQRAYRPDVALGDSLRLLKDYFAQTNRDLYEFLGREVPAWERFYSPGN